MNSQFRQNRWLKLGLVFIILPPMLFFIGTALWAAATYDGICPGIMDIAPYPCSRWEYIGRNTISPFSLGAQISICLGWGLFSGIAVILGYLARRLIGGPQRLR